MAFLKTARAHVVHADWNLDRWGNFIGENRQRLANGPYRVASGGVNLVQQASEILQQTFNPDQYVLTHCTIVASVDVEDVPNVKLGSVQEDGLRINRLYSDYRVLPECDKFLNNNHDGWSRAVLLKSYRTFIGAMNFLEHVQLAELSKGRVLDAVARDVGPSVYVDILVATDRKHTELVNDITSGKLGTLSMGCSCVTTTCTKCGNVAQDETDLCKHIKYAKGNYEFDCKGTKFRISELCGHQDLDPTGGVDFIEASWVTTPAFTGAVLRNILQPEVISVQTQDKIRKVLASPPSDWVCPPDQRAKAAKLAFDFGEDDAGDSPSPSAPAEPANPLDGIEKELEQYVLDNVKKRIKTKLQNKVQEEAASSHGELSTSTGNNVIHQASRMERRAAHYRHGIAALIRVARSDVDLLDNLARLNERLGVKISRDVYRTSLRVGSTANHDSLESYLAVCRKVLARKLTMGEAKTLVRLGQILSLRK